MNLTGNSNQNKSLIKDAWTEGEKGKKLFVSATSTIISTIIALAIIIIFITGAPLSTYKKTDGISAGIFDRADKTSSTNYNMYDDKWTWIAVTVIICIAVSALIQIVRYNRRPPSFLDFFSFFTTALSLGFMFVGAFLNSYTDNSGTSYGGVNVFHLKGESISGGCFFIFVLLFLYTIIMIRGWITRTNAKTVEEIEKEVQKEEKPSVNMDRVNADSFFENNSFESLEGSVEKYDSSSTSSNS